MCLSPIQIKNRSKYFNLSSLHKIDLTVPCGKCAECLAAKQNEYYFRSYYQSLETWDKGGYCLFDTLTYDNDHVPHINDFLSDDLKFESENNFTCFNMEDVRLFFVRLRRSLSYHGFDVKNKLKYFLCSEYGEDPRYTHRPHYHVMFYVTDYQIDPITLSRYIDKCWGNGMTDGEPYKGSSYVLKKRVFYKGADDLHMQNVCHYIGKYMVKDSEFTKVVNKRIKQVEDKIMRSNRHHIIDDDVKRKKYLKDIKRHCSQFIRQSQGFGLYMIEKLGKDWIFEHNCVRMPDQQNIWKEIPIPGYIVSKLFKEKKIDSNGEEYFGWSDYGIEFRMKHNAEQDLKLKRKILEVFDYSNLKNRGFSEDEIMGIYDVLDKNMAGRSLDDLIFYQKYMKGRIYFHQDDIEPDFESFYYVDQRSMLDDKSISRDDLFSYNDVSIYLIDNYVYVDKCFDNVLALYTRVSRRIAKDKQKIYDFKLDMEKRLKKEGFKFKVKY